MSSKTKRCRICRERKLKIHFFTNPRTGKKFRRCRSCPMTEDQKKILSKWRII